MMLHKKKSGNAARLKYLLVLPLTGALLCMSTLAFTKDYKLIDLAPRFTPSEKSSAIRNINENKKPGQPIPLNLTDTVKVPPPPPPLPPHKKIHDQIKLPPHKKIHDQIKLPPPPPPVAPKAS